MKVDPVWRDGILRSPETGLLLWPDTPHSISDGQDRWPVACGIPFLRIGRNDLRDEALVALDAGDERAALVELIRDQDDWAPGSPPDRQDVKTVLDGSSPLREAMEFLGFGPVSDYFTYRLSDPTYLAGLALMAAHWNAPRISFELACGIGHYSRELSRRGVETIAGDVVFAKLWLARRYVTPETRLVCFDAAAPFPLADPGVDVALCHDAFYFLPEKEHVAAELMRLAGDGTVIVGHVHNSLVENHSSGDPLTPEGYATLFPDPILYDDAELTECFFDGEEPRPQNTAALSGSEAIGIVAGNSDSHPSPDLTLPPSGTPLAPNPLYETRGDEPAHLRLIWPSKRYEAEYAPRSGYLPEKVSIPRGVLRRAADESVGLDPEVDRLGRQRVLLDLPEGW